MSITNVAKAAGVSVATVSRVLNGVPGVNPKMVEQVHAAVEEIKFVPRYARRSNLRTQSGTRLRTGNAGILTLGHGPDWLTLPVLATTLSGIQRGCDEIEGRLLIGETIDRSNPSIRMTNRDVDGVIIFIAADVSAEECRRVYKLVEQRFPLVRVMGIDNGVQGVDHVGPDNVGIGQLAYSYLRKHECKKVAFVSQHPDWAIMRMRFQAFLGAALDDNVVPTVYAVCPPSMNTAAFGPNVIRANTFPELVKKVVADTTDLEGLYFEHDNTCLQFHQVLADRASKFWKNIKAISCDNEISKMAVIHPKPATIDIGAEEIGFRAFKRLVNRIEHPNSPSFLLTVRPQIVLP